jgi:hypothetical protein
MNHSDPEELPDRDPTPPDAGDYFDNESEPGDGQPEGPEDCPACLGNHQCYQHNGGPIMPNDRPTWEDHAQAVKDGDKQAIGEDMMDRADHIKQELKERGEW